MSSVGPTAEREQRSTINVVIRLEATPVPTTAPAQTRWAASSYPVLLLLSALAAMLPYVLYVLSSATMTSIPRAAVVIWYGSTALLAGFAGIAWILHAAVLALKGPRETDIPLQGEAQKRVLEALSFHGTR